MKSARRTAKSTVQRVLASSNGVTYSVLTPADIEEAVHLAATVFPSQQEVCRVLGCVYEDYVPYFTAYVTEAARSGLGVVARSVHTRGTGKGLMVGMAYGRDFVAPSPPGISHENERLAVLTALRTPVARWYRDSIPNTPGVVLLLKTGVVMPGVANRNVGTTMASMLCHLGRAKGFLMATCRATGRASCHFFRDKLGFHELMRVPYRDWTWHGARPLAAANPKHADAYVALARPLVPGVWVGRRPAKTTVATDEARAVRCCGVTRRAVAASHLPRRRMAALRIVADVCLRSRL